MTTRKVVLKILARAIRDNERTFGDIGTVLNLIPPEEYPEHRQFVTDLLTMVVQVDIALKTLRELF